MNNIPIIGEQKPPTFPFTQIEINSQGWTITTHLAPNLALQHSIARNDIPTLVSEWQKVLQNEQLALKVARHVHETKNN